MKSIQLPLLSLVAAAMLGLAGTAARATLAVGDHAPVFTTKAALAGNEFDFSMAEALKKGPVVLYFFPRAFTSGCTVEAHNFAEATPQFEAMGATVIGMSTDDIDSLKKFSVEACRNKFPVAADANAEITQKYDAALWLKKDVSDRVSYMISPDGKVQYVYSSLSPDKHVENLMKALESWKAKAAAAQATQ